MSTDDKPLVGYVLVDIGLVGRMADVLDRMSGQLNIVETYASRVAALASATATSEQRAEWHRQALADIPMARDEAEHFGVAVQWLRQQLTMAAAPAGRVC